MTTSPTNACHDADSPEPTEPLMDLTPAWLENIDPGSTGLNVSDQESNALDSEHVLGLPARARQFLQAARDLKPQVRCFDFVPSNYENAWAILERLANLFATQPTRLDNLLESTWARHVSTYPAGTKLQFCEWGSGLGAVTGLASLLGFEACGVELDHGLSVLSNQLLAAHGLTPKIICASYFDIAPMADIYYVYGWPGQRDRVIERFLEIAPDHALLLLCDGQDVLRVKCRWPKPTA